MSSVMTEYGLLSKEDLKQFFDVYIDQLGYGNTRLCWFGGSVDELINSKEKMREVGDEKLIDLCAKYGMKCFQCDSDEVKKRPFRFFVKSN